ncbi:MAG: hypothetical protein ABIN96_01130 [Rubrivivax sp.]
MKKEEGLDERAARKEGVPAEAPADDAAEAARHAERDAHITPT